MTATRPARYTKGLDPEALERYLHAHIPVSRAMRVAVVDVSDTRLVLSAPLAPNINHRETVFGGSLSALAILSAWSLVHTRLRALGLEARLVIQRNTVHYDQPIAGTFTATATLPSPQTWDAFLRTLSRRGKARIALSSVLECDGAVGGRFEGHFVALGR